jgi:hypothetical protein
MPSMTAPTQYTLYKDWMAALNAEALRRGAASNGTQPLADKDNFWRDAFAKGFSPERALDEQGYQDITIQDSRGFWQLRRRVKAALHLVFPRRK